MSANLSASGTNDGNEINAREVEKELKRRDPEILRKIPKEHVQKVIRETIGIVSQKIHIGPIPDPETLEQYNLLLPNAAQRIFDLAEKQADHRMELEKKVVLGQVQQSKLGQIFAFLIGIAALIAACYMAYIGKELAASVIGGGGIIGLVTAFIQGKRVQTRSLEEKRQDKR